MTDQIDRKFTILAVLVAGLLVAVVVQSAVIFGLYGKLGRSVAKPERPTPSIVKDDHSRLRPKAVLPAKPFDQDKDLFSWDLDDWDPFKEMHSMQDRINQMFGSAFGRFQKSDEFGDLLGKYAFSPDINLEDKGDHYLVTVDLPGVEDTRLDVKIEGQTLTISGSVQSESTETDKGKMLRQERRSGKFQRIVTLPSSVKADKMITTNKKGVVTITIPKATE